MAHRRAFLGQCRVEIVHMAGERNCWGDFLPGQRALRTPFTPEGPVPLHGAAVLAVPKADYSLPTKDASPFWSRRSLGFRCRVARRRPSSVLPSPRGDAFARAPVDEVSEVNGASSYTVSICLTLAMLPPGDPWGRVGSRGLDSCRRVGVGEGRGRVSAWASLDHSLAVHPDVHKRLP